MEGGGAEVTGEVIGSGSKGGSVLGSEPMFLSSSASSAMALIMATTSDAPTLNKLYAHASK